MNEYWNVMVPELTVFDFEETIDFYTNILGFSVKYQRNDPKFAYLEYEKQIQLMIEMHHETGWATGNLEYPLGRGINLQMEVANIDLLLNKIKEMKYPLFREVNCSQYVEDKIIHKQKEFLIQDPNGYLLRFCEIVG